MEATPHPDELRASSNVPPARQALAWLGALIALVAVMLVVDRLGHSVKDFTRDPGSISEIDWWKGSLSLLGSMLWGAAAMAFAVGATTSSTDRGYFAAMSLASAGLGLDDSLRIHENAFPEVLGVPEKAVFALYALALAVVVWRHRHRILLHHPVPILVTGFGMAASVALDLLFDRGTPNLIGSLEDVPKVWGIAALAAFAFLEARGTARQVADPVIIEATDLDGPTRRVDPEPLQP